MAETHGKKLLHTRQVLCQAFELDPEHWQVLGRMTDIKTFDMDNRDRGGHIPAGEPLHDISLSLTLNKQLRIVAVEATIDESPFKACNTISQAFQALVGLSITPGISAKAKELLGGINGCTHLLELLPPIITTAYQTFFTSPQGVVNTNSEYGKMLINSCHMMAEDGEVVKLLQGET